MADSLHGAYAPPDPAFDQRFAKIAFSLLIVITLATSYIHYAHPGIFRVPSNTDISTWQHPSFEDTCLYEQMTENERQAFLEQGVPYGDNLWFQFVEPNIRTYSPAINLAASHKRKILTPMNRVNRSAI